MSYVQGFIIALVALVSANKLELIDTLGFFILLALLLIDAWFDDQPIKRAKR